MPPSSCAPNAERKLTGLLLLAYIAAAAIVASGLFLFSLGYDEAWILQGLSDIVHRPDARLAVNVVWTHGGLFALANLLIGAVAGHALWAHRLFSALCLCGVVAIVARWGRKLVGSCPGGLLAASVLIAMPGTLLLGATAYGSVPGLLITLIVIAVWDATPQKRELRWVVCGLLTGLAVATRWEYMALFAAWPVWALLDPHDRLPRFIDSVITTIIAMGFFTLLMRVLMAVGAHVDAAPVASYGFNYPFLLNKLMIAQSALPLALMVGATFVAWVLWQRGGFCRSAQSLLIPCAWFIWAAWLLVSPIPHLRYFWPALACFAIPLGLGIARLYQWGNTPERAVARWAALLLALACLAQGLSLGARELAQGDSNILSWEWSREGPVELFRRFQYVHDQRAAARYVTEHIAPDEEIGVLGLDRELRYLTDRRIIPLSDDAAHDAWKPGLALPHRLIISPMVGAYLYMNPQAYRWVQDNCRLDAQFGRYSFYTVTGTYPATPHDLALPRVSYVAQPLSIPYHDLWWPPRPAH